MNPETISTRLQAFLEAVCRFCTDEFSEVTKASWTFRVSSEGAPPAEGAPLQFTVSASGAFSGEATIQVASSSAAVFAGALTAKMAESPEEHVEVLRDFLQRAVAAGAAALKSDLGEAQLQIAAGEAATWKPAQFTTLVAAGADAEVHPLHLAFSHEFVGGMTAEPASNPAELPPDAGKHVSVESNLDLLMNIDLEVTLRFGRRHLTLKEIVGLTPGSVVALENDVKDPVELLLGEKVIARGEVVVVDGNFGLRVTESPTRGSNADAH